MTNTTRRRFHQTPRHFDHRLANLSRPAPSLRTITGRVRTVSVTPDGHAACEIRTATERLRALSDATPIHLPLLRSGGDVRVVLLRIRRKTVYGSWDWQLMACQGLDTVQSHQAEGSAAAEGQGAHR